MRKRTDIRRPEILKEIGRMVSCGANWAEITRHINHEFGTTVSNKAIQRAYQTYATRRSELMQGDKEVREEIKEEILDWKNQISKINEKCWEILDNAETSDKDKLKAMGEIRQQLDLQNKILSKMEENINQREFSRIEATRMLFDQLRKLEDDGMIKILRMPGRTIELAKPVGDAHEENDQKRTDKPRTPER